MEEPLLFWTKAAAIGQIAGAIATFLAVVISLWVVLSERKEQLKLSVGERVLLGNSMGEVDLISFQLTNVGLRTVRISTFGWRTGWLRRGPEFLRHRWAIQTADVGLPSNDPPFTLEPGHSASFLLRLDLILKERPTDDYLFGARKFPLLGMVRPRICGSVHTDRGTRVIVPIEKALKVTLTQKVED